MRKLLPFLILLLAAAPALADPPEGINLRKTIVVQVAAETKAAVVKISTTKLVHVNPFGGNPFFQQFDFGSVTANTLGSGFIVHPDGYVVTNNHVIDQAREIIVELDNGMKLNASLISADADADLALLKISDKQPFPTLQLGDSEDLMIGEPTIAVGNPLGYSHSVSSGIVSALHRDLQTNEGKAQMKNLIQTDAAINPGNSGGPLLNAYGQVIGINTAIRSDAQNIGFAISVNSLRDLIPELMNPAQVNKLDIGLKLHEKRSITPPADVHVEILTGDNPPKVIHDIGGRAPRDIVDAYDLLLHAKADQPLEVTFAGGGDEKIVPHAAPLPDGIVQAKQKLGLTLEQMTPMLAQKNGLNVDSGLYVTGVTKGSLADTAGIEPGDVLVRVSQFRVDTLADLSSLLQRWPGSGHVRFMIVRGESSGYGVFDLGSPAGRT